MNELVLPVPETLSASYMVPVPLPMDATEVRRRARRAVEALLPEPLRMMTVNWIAEGVVSIDVQPQERHDLAPASDSPACGTPEQEEFISTARAIVQFSASNRATFLAMHEWKARGPAAALATDLGAPVFDLQAGRVLSAEDALAALPDTQLAGATDDQVNIRLGFDPWVRLDDYLCQGRIWLITDGMCRFGLPELRVGGATPKVREELRMLLHGLAFRLWSALLKDAQATPRAAGLMSMPPFLQIAAEMDISRADLDRARGVPNRGGSCTTVRLRFDPAASEDAKNWLTVCPTSDWDLSWEDFIADTCHALFGFEKPRWHYMPEFGALLDSVGRARNTVSQARDRFLRGDFPANGQLMIRHRAASASDFAWAIVESWDNAERPIVRDVGRELTPGIRPGTSAPVDESAIADWAVWVDGKGVVEGGATEGLGHNLV